MYPHGGSSCYENSNCLSQRSDWINFSFGWKLFYGTQNLSVEGGPLSGHIRVNQKWKITLTENDECKVPRGHFNFLFLIQKFYDECLNAIRNSGDHFSFSGLFPKL